MRLRNFRRPVKFSAAAPVVGPVLGSLTPSSASQYDNGLTLTVDGSGFNPGDVVYWDAVALATTYVNANQLTAVVPSSKFYTSGSKTVNVNGTSNDLSFTVTAWSVADMTGVTAWWRADDIVENPAGFCQTMNARVGAFTLTQATGSNRPEFYTEAALNNRPCLRHNTGIAQSLGTTAQMQNLITTTDGTILAVGAIDAAAATVVWIGPAGGVLGFLAKASGAIVRSTNYDGTFDESSTPNAFGTVTRFEWRHTGGTLYLRVGNTEGSIASGTTTLGMTSTFAVFSPIATAHIQRAAEIITLNVAIGATDRIRYNNYIEDRYAIPA